MTGALNSSRRAHTATLLTNGKVLVAGGYNATSVLGSAELYDPELETWTFTGSLNARRDYHTATLLPNGKVLVAGGSISAPGSYPNAEIYDPATGQWTATGEFSGLREDHRATLLPNGRVLVAGGWGQGVPSPVLSSAAVYNPATETWTTTAQTMTTPRYFQGATLLPNGLVLMTGGVTGSLAFTASAELYDPGAIVSGTIWRLTGAMSTPRYLATTTVIPDGRVLVTGGANSGGALASAELYDSGLAFGGSWRPQITNVNSTLHAGDSLTVTGVQFRGISEASEGNTQDSSADYPLLQLRNVESERTVFLSPTNWSTNSFTSVPLTGFPSGLALATVFVNGIPSTSSVYTVSVPIPTPPILTNPTKLTNGSFQFSFTNTTGVLFGVLTTTNLTIPRSNWTALGGVVEVSTGNFQFTDPPVAGRAQRFYCVRVP